MYCTLLYCKQCNQTRGQFCLHNYTSYMLSLDTLSQQTKKSFPFCYLSGQHIGYPKGFSLQMHRDETIMIMRRRTMTMKITIIWIQTRVKWSAGLSRPATLTHGDNAGDTVTGSSCNWFSLLHNRQTDTKQQDKDDCHTVSASAYVNSMKITQIHIVGNNLIFSPRSFCTAVPTISNSLPNSVRSPVHSTFSGCTSNHTFTKQLSIPLAAHSSASYSVMWFIALHKFTYLLT